MVRVLHFADFHLGVENYGRVDPQTGLSSRVRDFLDRLDELVDFALRENVDVVAFAGDAFRNRRPDPTYQRDFARRIARLSQAGVHVVLVAGNHDLPSMLVKATSLDIFRALNVQNVHVSARSEEVLRLSLSEGRELQVATFPYPNRSRLLVSDEHRRRSLREQEEVLRAQVTQSLHDLTEYIDPDIPAILVGHLTVLGADLGSEQRMSLGYDPDALLGSLALPVYDAVLLGHLHRTQILREEQPLVLYAGSLERVDFGDEGVDKGFYLIEIDETAPPPRPLSYRFISVSARPFLTLQVDARQGQVMERALRAIDEAAEAGLIADAVLRLHLHLREEDVGLVDLTALRQALEPAFFVAAIAVNVDRSERLTFRGALEQLGPMEALERYWIARGVSAKRREILSQYAQILLEEVH
ncbi:MAG: exonuclease SbcCD subunit D [Chloroflexia bacterium]|nr:exonuclease SbcCD subunit D [Chloroflexia bacterium]